MGLILMTGDVRVYDTPRLVAPIVYDQSKKHVFRLHYGLKEAGWTLRFAYTDTDSLIYQIRLKQGLTFLQMMQEWNETHGAEKGYFDCTGFLGMDSDGKPIKCRHNGQLGSFKVEHGAPGDEILEFIALASKLYAILTANPKEPEILHAKGLPKWVITLHGMEAFRQAIQGAARQTHDIPIFKNVNLHSTATTMTRAGVAPLNDKCVIWVERENGQRRFVTLPHGYVGRAGCRMAQRMVISQAPFVKELEISNDEWKAVCFTE
jgi:hypothetical protein